MGHLIVRYRVGVRRAREVVRQNCSAWYYQSRENGVAPLLRRIEEIAAARVRYGFWRIFVLLRREGWWIAHDPAPIATAPKERRPQKKTRQQIEQIEAPPITKQHMVVQRIDAIIAHAARRNSHQHRKRRGPQRCGPRAS